MKFSHGSSSIPQSLCCDQKNLTLSLCCWWSPSLALVNFTSTPLDAMDADIPLVFWLMAPSPLLFCCITQNPKQNKTKQTCTYNIPVDTSFSPKDLLQTCSVIHHLCRVNPTSMEHFPRPLVHLLPYLTPSLVALLPTVRSALPSSSDCREAGLSPRRTLQQ